MTATIEAQAGLQEIGALKTRILAVISQICRDGFTTNWYPSQRGRETRETFRFDSSHRMQIMTGAAETLILHVEVRKGKDGPVSAVLPDACDWALSGLVDWIQWLDDADVANLPAPMMNRRPVQLMKDILDTIGTDQTVRVGATEYSAFLTNDDTEENPPIAIKARNLGMLDDKWSAESFLLQGRG